MQMMCTDKIRAFEYGRFSAIRYAARAQLFSQKQARSVSSTNPLSHTLAEILRRDEWSR